MRSQYWFRCIMQQTITWAIVDRGLGHYMTSLGHDEWKYRSCWCNHLVVLAVANVILMQNDSKPSALAQIHDDVIKWKHFSRYWPFVRGIHRWIPHTKASDAKLWCFLCAWINDWVNNCEAGDLRRHRAHYDVIVMISRIAHLIKIFSEWCHNSSKCVKPLLLQKIWWRGAKCNSIAYALE